MHKHSLLDPKLEVYIDALHERADELKRLWLVTLVLLLVSLAAHVYRSF